MSVNFKSKSRNDRIAGESTNSISTKPKSQSQSAYKDNNVIQGYYEVELPDSWGTLKFWAKQKSAPPNKVGQFNYSLHLAAPPEEESQAVESNYAVPSHSTNEKDMETEVANGNFAKINWSDYEYDPEILYKSVTINGNIKSVNEAGVEEERQQVRQIIGNGR